MIITSKQKINDKEKTSELKRDTFAFIEEVHAPRKLTIEQLRKHGEYKNATEEECIKIIDTLYKLSIIAYLYYVDNEKK